MRADLSLVVAAVLVLPLSLGCKPQSVVEQPSAEKPVVNVSPDEAQPPATESTATTPNDDKANVDVAEGGSQGVQVEAQESTPQQ